MIFTTAMSLSNTGLLTTIYGNSAGVAGGQGGATEFDTLTPCMLESLLLIADVAYDEPRSSLASAILAWISVLVIEVAMMPRFS